MFFNKKIKLIMLLYVISVAAIAQSTTESKPLNSMNFVIGASRHGTDDVLGISFSAGYNRNFKQRLCGSIRISGTIHDGYYNISYFDDIKDQIWKPGKLYFVTGGLQVEIVSKYSLIISGRHTFQVGFGSVLRYQTSSNPDYANVNFYAPLYFPSYTHFKRTLAFGGIGTLDYSYSLSNDAFFLLSASLQYDTNEDAITMLGFGLGKRF